MADALLLGLTSGESSRLALRLGGGKFHIVLVEASLLGREYGLGKHLESLTAGCGLGTAERCIGDDGTTGERMLGSRLGIRFEDGARGESDIAVVEAAELGLTSG